MNLNNLSLLIFIFASMLAAYKLLNGVFQTFLKKKTGCAGSCSCQARELTIKKKVNQDLKIIR